MTATEEVWMPGEVHNYDRGSTYRNDECLCWRGSLRIVQCYKFVLSTMLDEAFRDMGDGVYIQTRQSADLFNVAHFRAKTNTTRILVRELLFANYTSCPLC